MKTLWIRHNKPGAKLEKMLTFKIHASFFKKKIFLVSYWYFPSKENEQISSILYLFFLKKGNLNIILNIVNSFIWNKAYIVLSCICFHACLCLFFYSVGIINEMWIFVNNGTFSLVSPHQSQLKISTWKNGQFSCINSF